MSRAATHEPTPAGRACETCQDRKVRDRVLCFDCYRADRNERRGQLRPDPAQLPFLRPARERARPARPHGDTVGVNSTAQSADIGQGVAPAVRALTTRNPLTAAAIGHRRRMLSHLAARRVAAGSEP